MIYEFRTYVAAPGKMEALLARFRLHTVGLLEKHGITNVGYWTSAANGEGDHLMFLLRFRDPEHHDTAWKSFIGDPEWQAIRTESHRDGALVQEVRSQLLKPTDFSPLK